MLTKDDNIHIVEGFVWKLLDIKTARQLILAENIFEVYCIMSDNSEFLVESLGAMNRIIEIDKNAQFAIEVGHLPNNYTQIENNDKQVKQ